MFVLAHHYRGKNHTLFFTLPTLPGKRPTPVFRTTVWKTTGFLFQSFRPLAFGWHRSLAALGHAPAACFRNFPRPVSLRFFLESFRTLGPVTRGLHRSFGLQKIDILDGAQAEGFSEHERRNTDRSSTLLLSS